MHVGVLMFPTDYAIRPDDLARAAEERRFESLWFPEHTHVPTARRSPWPGGPVLPKEYWHTHDPFVALAAAAAVTTRLRVATGVCLLVERDPITTGKEVASLDVMSRGRFLFGVGGGWNAEEMEDHGTDFRSRWRVLRDLRDGIAELRRRAQAKGRDPATVTVSAYGAPMDRDRLARLADLGIERAILPLPSADADTVLPLLDRGAALARSLLG